MTTVDYTGRIIDLFIFADAKLAGDQQIFLSLLGETGGKITTGIQKMAQTFAILFLTEKGSVLYYPDLGSDFVTNVRYGRIRDESDVQSLFALAAGDVLRSMQLEAANASLPSDESLASVTLNSFKLDKEASLLSLFVKLLSAAGESRDIVLPVPVPIK